MFNEDPTRTHVSVARDSIVGLYESTNQPLVQVPGKSAQAAQAAVVASHVGHGYEVVIALTFLESGDNVLYTPDQVVDDGGLPQKVEEALDFAESMGFILDSAGWASLSSERRDELRSRLPAFRAPTQQRLVSKASIPRQQDSLAAIARLFAAFVLPLALLLSACSGPSAEQRRHAAEIHYDLGTSLLQNGDPQGALREYRQANEEDDSVPQVHNAMGLLYAYSLGKPQEAEAELKKAIELDKNFAEAHNNLGAFYLTQARYTEAVKEFELALSNDLYRERVVAETNLGWALYKSGQAQKGVQRIKAALALNPKYCLGWRQLGTIYSERNDLPSAVDAFGKYAASCPDAADAHLQYAKTLVRQGRAKDARDEFERCAKTTDAREDNVRAECDRLLKDLKGA
ncbi:MAG: social motility TPR repeat lipoprotein Tgl [Myxococcales bacterium]